MSTQIVNDLHQFKAKKKASTARLEIEGRLINKGLLSENRKKHLDMFEELLSNALETAENIRSLKRLLKQQRIALSSALSRHM